MTLLATLIFWILLFYAFFRRGPMLIFMFFGSMAFGTFAVLPTAVTGGLTIIPTPVIALFIVIRTFGSVSGLKRLLNLFVRLDRLAILSAYWVVAIYTALFMPRLFAGLIEVIPFRGNDLSVTSALVPSTQNVSQLGYLTISVFTVFAFADMLRHEEARGQVVRGLIFGGGMVVATGFLDFASQYVPIGPLLDPVRTATYALATEVVVLGGKRVVGLMSEASAFGPLALSYLMLLYFLRPSLEKRSQRDIVVPVILVCLVALVYASRSSSAYVGFGLFVAVALADNFWEFIRKRSKRRSGFVVEFWAVYLTALTALFLVIVEPTVVDPVIDLVNRMVFEKTNTGSYDQRGLWRSTAWEALWNSYGAGIGVGSTRSSSEIAGVFAATGFLGGLLYYSFVMQTLTRRPRPGDGEGHAFIRSVRYTLLPILVVSYFVGSADFGAFSAMMYGLAAGTAFASRASRAPLFPLVHDGSRLGTRSRWSHAK